MTVHSSWRDDAACRNADPDLFFWGYYRGCCNVQHMALAGGTSTKPMEIIGGGKAGAPQPRLCATRVSAGRP